MLIWHKGLSQQKVFVCLVAVIWHSPSCSFSLSLSPSIMPHSLIAAFRVRKLHAVESVHFMCHYQQTAPQNSAVTLN